MDNSIEQIWCSMKYGCETILLGCIHRPPKCTKIGELTRSLKGAKEFIDNKSYSGILLCGDFNIPLINWDSFGFPHTNTGSLFENNFVVCLLDCAFFQHVYFATFF